MGAYLGYTFVWKLLHLPLEVRYMGTYMGVGACPGYYGIVHVRYIQLQVIAQALTYAVAAPAQTAENKENINLKIVKTSIHSGP